MPNDNIKRTIDKALGSGNTDNYESVTYEGYGPGGVAVIVEALTDNRQRTAPEVRHYFDKFGKGMGAQGCVSWSFDRKGVIIIDNEDGDCDEDTVMMDALEAGAEPTCTADGPVFEITTDPDAFNDVVAGAGGQGLHLCQRRHRAWSRRTTSSSRARRTSRTWKSCSICWRTTRTCRTPTTTGRPRTKVHRNNEKTDGTPSVFPYSCEQDCKPGSVSDSHLSTRRVAACAPATPGAVGPTLGREAPAPIPVLLRIEFTASDTLEPTGALLPHLSTLIRQIATGSLFLLHFSSESLCGGRYPLSLPCGARTFLTASLSALPRDRLSYSRSLL